MTVLPSSSDEYTRNYRVIFSSNIPDPKCQVNIWTISNRSFISKYLSKVHKSNADRNPRISSLKWVYPHSNRVNTYKVTTQSIHRTFPISLSRLVVPEYIKFQMRYISVYVPAIFTIRMASKSHDSPLDNDGITNILRSIYAELQRHLYIEHSVPDSSPHIGISHGKMAIFIWPTTDDLKPRTSKFQKNTIKRYIK